MGEVGYLTHSNPGSLPSAPSGIGEHGSSRRSRRGGGLAREREWVRFGLGRKLLGWFLVLSLVPLGASSALGYLRSRSIIEGLVARYLGGIAEAQAVHVGDQVREQLLLLERFSQAVEYPDDPDSGEAHEAALGTIFEQEPSFEALFIFDAQGRVLTLADADPRTSDRTGQDQLEPYNR